MMREQLLRAIKLAPDYAPAHYLLALVDRRHQRTTRRSARDGPKARQLAPAKASYSLLLAEIYLRRSDPDRRARFSSHSRATPISRYGTKPKPARVLEWK